MKFIVDLNTCENHGQCTYLAGDVFALDANGDLNLRALTTSDEYVSEELAADVIEDIQEAADMCPVQAIRLEA